MPRKAQEDERRDACRVFPKRIASLQRVRGDLKRQEESERSLR